VATLRICAYIDQQINERGLDAQRVISVDWGLHNQLHALAPRKLQRRMRDYWPAFQKLGKGKSGGAEREAELNIS
jgi:hypothetical protein